MDMDLPLTDCLNEPEENLNTTVESSNIALMSFCLQYNFFLLEFEYVKCKGFHKLICHCNNHTYVSNKLPNSCLCKLIQVAASEKFEVLISKIFSKGPNSQNLVEFDIKQKTQNSITLDLQNKANPNVIIRYELFCLKENFMAMQSLKYEIEMLEVQRKMKIIKELVQRKRIKDSVSLNDSNHLQNILSRCEHNNNSVFSFLCNKIKELESLYSATNQNLVDLSSKLGEA